MPTYLAPGSRLYVRSITSCKLDFCLTNEPMFPRNGTGGTCGIPCFLKKSLFLVAR